MEKKPMFEKHQTNPFINVKKGASAGTVLEPVHPRELGPTTPHIPEMPAVSQVLNWDLLMGTGECWPVFSLTSSRPHTQVLTPGLPVSVMLVG